MKRQKHYLFIKYFSNYMYLLKEMALLYRHRWNCWVSPDVMAAMLEYSKQKNFDYFFCLGLQHGRYDYCLLCLWGLCETQEYQDFSSDKNLVSREDTIFIFHNMKIQQLYDYFSLAKEIIVIVLVFHWCLYNKLNIISVCGYDLNTRR